MKSLTVDSSNHSISCALIEMNDDSILATIIVERIGLLNGKITIKKADEVIIEEKELENHEMAVKEIIDKFISLNLLVLSELRVVGHKVIRGSKIYKDPVIIDQKLLEELEELTDLNALPISAEVLGIKAFQECLKEVTQLAIFDSSFFADLPVENHLYAVPYHWYQDFGVRKYGYRGLNHNYINQEVKKLLGKDSYKLISCYLDKGVSISAIEDGKCLDTSMGFTPISGAMMSNRAGNIDASIIPFIMKKEGKNASEVIADLNYNSGLLGVSEFSADIKEILKQCAENNEKALIAKNKYIRDIVSFIAEYFVLLGGVDILVFTGDIGENSPEIREEICSKLTSLGISLVNEKNKELPDDGLISSKDDNTLVYVMSQDDHLLIWNEIKKSLNR